MNDEHENAGPRPYEMLDISVLMNAHVELTMSAKELDVPFDDLVQDLRQIDEAFDRLAAISATLGAGSTRSQQRGAPHDGVQVAQQSGATHERLLIEKESHDGVQITQRMRAHLERLREQRAMFLENCQRFLISAVNHYIAFLPDKANLAQPAEDGMDAFPRIDLVNPALLDADSDFITRDTAYAEGSMDPLQNVQTSPY